jgi:hypothetical protein
MRLTLQNNLWTFFINLFTEQTSYILVKSAINSPHIKRVIILSLKVFLAEFSCAFLMHPNNY